MVVTFSVVQSLTLRLQYKSRSRSCYLSYVSKILLENSSITESMLEIRFIRFFVYNIWREENFSYFCPDASMWRTKNRAYDRFPINSRAKWVLAFRSRVFIKWGVEEEKGRDNINIALVSISFSVSRIWKIEVYEQMHSRVYCYKIWHLRQSKTSHWIVYFYIVYIYIH